ncbi:Demethylmenaquinone methyltransferase [Dichotomopilus funicola]|uniref:Demethylmenaquinone methyltransferase n=1 Tax=Dichotomopilus funicola TaxID=1934379 RepID=A0AAN6V3I7_9PEZI|nr:Demethylmenaquinone methyltransferase [Dichotomopilus funicola]
MASRPTDQTLDNYEFTFESYLNNSARIEPDRSDSRSISESINTFQTEFGRTYHSYRAGSYLYPNDDTENNRAEEQYMIMKEAMDGRLHLAPFSRANPPRKVLDIATGTGLWAIEMGDLYPEAEIIGTDLSPIQPDFVPPNVHFFVEDSSEDWFYPPEFDFIHTRVTIGCWSDMKKQILQRAFDHLRPGGWFESQEIPVGIDCDDGTLTDNYGWARWVREFRAGSRIANRQVDNGPQIKEWMCEIGFVDVHEVVIKIPMNGWPKNLRLKQLGMMWQRILLEGVSGFSLRTFNRSLNQTVEEIEVLLVDVRKSLLDRSVHAYHRLYVVCGRKPEAA